MLTLFYVFRDVYFISRTASLTGNFGSRVTVHGGNEALPSYSFKDLPKSHILLSLPEARVCLLFMHIAWIYVEFFEKKC